MDWNNKIPMVDSSMVPPYYTGLVGDYLALIHKEILDFVENASPGFRVERIKSEAVSSYDKPGYLDRVMGTFTVIARNMQDEDVTITCKVLADMHMVAVTDVSMRVG